MKVRFNTLGIEICVVKNTTGFEDFTWYEVVEDYDPKTHRLRLGIEGNVYTEPRPKRVLESLPTKCIVCESVRCAIEEYCLLFNENLLKAYNEKIYTSSEVEEIQRPFFETNSKLLRGDVEGGEIELGKIVPGGALTKVMLSGIKSDILEIINKPI